MKRSSQILPTLLLLIFGGVGLLWLSEAPRIEAAGQTPPADAPPVTTPEATLVALGRSPESSPESAPGIRWPRKSTGPLEVASPAPARVFGPEEVAQLRRRIEEQKAEHKRLRLIERQHSEELWLAQRAGELTHELDLPADSAELLREVLLGERVRQSETWERVRTCGSTRESRRMLREEMNAVREWREAELTRLFGEDVARRINQAETGKLAAQK